MGAVTRRSPFASQPQGTRRHRPDYWLLILAALLLAIGLVVVYAISPALIVEKNVPGSFYVTRQLIAVGLGMVVFGITAAIPIDRWKRTHTLLLIAAALVTFVALVQPTAGCAWARSRSNLLSW
jgi:cell division protein FtsW (lipid II flippase)